MATYNGKQRTSSEADTVVVQGDVKTNSPDLSSPDSKQVDDTYAAYKEGLNDEVSPAEAKSVLRKTDLRIFPIILLAYLVQYLDKQGINFASVFGLLKGNHLKGQDYSWTSSIFYFGYLIAQYPAGYAMQKLPIGKYLASVTLGKSLLLNKIVSHTLADTY
jgi:sugar phosphate permease